MNPLLAVNLRAARHKAGLTLAQAAASIGVQLNTVSRWERGERTPAADILPAIARAYGTMPDALLGGV